MREADLTFDKLLDEIARSLASLSVKPFEGVMAEAKPLVHRDIRAGFNSSADPMNNESWPLRKRRYPHPILIKSGALMQAATGGGAGAIQDVKSDSLTVGVNGSLIGYAAFHMFGAGKLPARPFVGAKDETIDAIGEMIADEGLKAFLET